MDNGTPQPWEVGYPEASAIRATAGPRAVTVSVDDPSWTITLLRITQYSATGRIRLPFVGSATLGRFADLPYSSLSSSGIWLPPASVKMQCKSPIHIVVRTHDPHPHEIGASESE